MGSQKTTQTQTTTIPGASAAESGLYRLLQQLAERGTSQLGDLSKLAAGEVGSPSGSDQELIARSIGYATDIAKRNAIQSSSELQAKLSEQLAAMGMQGGSGEFVQRGMLQRDLQRQIEDQISRAQMAGGEALMNLPFQRAQMQLGANQALFQQIIGAASPAMQAMLQARLAQPTSTMTQEAPWSPSDIAALAKTGGALAAAPFTGGASLATLGIPTGGGSKQMIMPNTQMINQVYPAPTGLNWGSLGMQTGRNR